MAKIINFEVFSVDLPFKKPFKHAAATRLVSQSIVLKCESDSGVFGFGETLPREYVTGETVESTFDLLHSHLLPRLIGKEFNSLQEVKDFLTECDGNAPKGWVEEKHPHTAAWCAIDIALLDTFGKVFNENVTLNNEKNIPDHFRYSPVVSGDSGLKFIKTLLKVRLAGCKQVKLKVGSKPSFFACLLARIILGRKCEIRIDANMAWTIEQAVDIIDKLKKLRITVFEQPLASDNLQGLSELVKKTDSDIMVDESLTDKKSLENLIELKACTALNVRISKCGGLMAAYARCREALKHGLKIQLGCLTGETSLLSAANLTLLRAVQSVSYGESCFGLFLLKEDPAEPLLQFGYKGKPPELPAVSGLGITMNKEILENYITRVAKIK